MKIFKQGLAASVCLLFASVFQSFASEGLQISVQCSNVVLTWPTVDGSGDTYLIRRRTDLSTNSSWVMVADGYSAASGTNLTTYTDVGIVTNANCNGGGGEMMGMVRRGFSTTTDSTDVSTNLPPLPPGLAYSTNTDGFLALTFSVGLHHSFTADDDGPGVPEGGTPSGTPPTNAPFDGAFYEVVKDGATLYGLTNGMTVSGILELPVEVASSSGGQLTTLALEDYGKCFRRLG